MTETEILEWLRSADEPAFRASQIFKWVHSDIKSFDEMSNIPKNLRETLNDNFYLATVIAKKRLVSTMDDTVKYLYALNDGEIIESVCMSYKHGYSVCISTQVGCRMGCSFCASGKDGFVRNLTASEMLEQISFAGRDKGARINNVVMMGMGEPLDNFDNVTRFLELVSNENVLGIGMRHIALSTSGVVPRIDDLANLGVQITLSISLHAPNDTIRSQTMPVNKLWGISELILACRSYINKTGRRISFEYALIKGINDSNECCDELAKRLKGMLCHVNLIPANPIDGNHFDKPDKASIEKFRNRLLVHGINTTIRRTLGSDINASCGQLRHSSRKEAKEV